MFKTILAAGAAAALAAMPAAAVVKKATYTGLILEGTDFGGYFVPYQSDVDRSDLSGFRYVATYIYDTGINADQSDDRARLGGTNYGEPSALISATITINGNSKSITGSLITELFATSNYVSHYSWERASGGFPFTYSNFLTNFGNPTSAPDSLKLNFAASTFSGGGSFSIDDFRDYEYQIARGTFASEVTYSVANVPEPASWALMILGFGVVGTASRRRNRVLAL